MSVTINAKGTSTSSFKVGKNGLTLEQAGTISPPTNSDLVVALDENKTLVVDAGGAGPALITCSDDQDLHINPATGGGQYLFFNDTRWPVTTGTNGQTLVTDGTGILSWVDAAGTGTVTSASVATANGFSGTVATATSTPAITLFTTVTGLLSGSSGALTNAVAGDITPLIDGTYVNVSGDTMTGALNVPSIVAGSTGSQFGTITVNHSGASYPALTLGSQADTTANTGLYFRQTSGQAGISTAGSGLSFFQGGPGTTETMRLDSSGNWMVGTSVYFGTKASIQGDLMVGASGAYKTNPNAKISVYGASNTEASISTHQAGIASALIGHKSGDSSFYLTNTYAGDPIGTIAKSIVLDQNGNVGLGSSSSGAYRTYIQALTAQKGLYVGSDTGNPQIVTGDGNVSVYTAYTSGTGGTAVSYYGTSTNHTQAFIVNNSERARITTDGDFFIGTSSGSGRLGVDSGTGGLFANFNTTNASGGYIRFQNSGTSVADFGTGAQIVTAGSSTDFGINARTGNVILATAQTERARIDQSGNMGVGTAPSARLHVVGGTASFPATSGTTQTGNFARLQTNGSGLTLDVGGFGGNGAWLQATNTGDLSSNYPLLLNPNGGNVGVGTTAPAFKLDVNGSFRSAGAGYINTLLTQRLTYNGYPATGLLNGSIDEYAMAGGSIVLGDGIQSDLLAFNPPTSAEWWNGSSWSGATILPNVFAGKLSMNYGSAYAIAPATTKLRFTWNGLGYKFWDAIIISGSTNGNDITLLVEGSTDGTSWTTFNGGSSGAMSSWPGPLIWKAAGNNNSAYPYFRLTITRTSTNANNVDIGQISMLGCYGGATRLFDWDYQRNVTFSNTVNAPTFNATSTIRVKDDVADLGNDYLNKFSQLRPREYNRTDMQKHEFGFIAEEMAEIYPEVVGRDSDGTPSGIDYGKLSTILTAKVQEQQTVIDELKEQVSKIMQVLKSLT